MNNKINLYSDILLRAGNMSIRLMTDSNIANESGFIKILHSHNYYELFYVTNGKMTVGLQDRIMTVEANSFIVIPPEQLHYIISHDPSTERFSIGFQLIEGESSPDGHMFRQQINSLIPYIAEEPQSAYSAFHRMEGYYMSQNPNKLNLMAACFYEILYLYISSAGKNSAETAIDRYETDESYRTYLIDNYVNLNFCGEVTLTELAKKVFLSESQVNRIMKAHYGRSLHQHIIYLRMKNAASLLSDTKLKVKDIAAAVGYKSVHGFNCAFRKAYGIAPEIYRRNDGCSEQQP